MNPKQAFEEMEKADKAIRTVSNKDWLILNYISGKEDVFSKRNDGLWYGLFSALEEKDIAASKEHTIYCVKRLTDGEIFNVGDAVEDDEKITGFYISQGELFVNFTEKKPNHGDSTTHINTISKYKPKVVTKLKGTDSFLVVGGHIPCAFYSPNSDWWWNFNEKTQAYELDQPDASLLVTESNLRMFEKGNYLPFYNYNQVKQFISFL